MERGGKKGTTLIKYIAYSALAFMIMRSVAVLCSLVPSYMAHQI